MEDELVDITNHIQPLGEEIKVQDEKFLDWIENVFLWSIIFNEISNERFNFTLGIRK